MSLLILWIVCVVREVSSVEDDGEDGQVPPKKKKKKSEKKRKKKKKHKKRSGKYSNSSGSDSETIYPSDLKKEQEANRYLLMFVPHSVICILMFFVKL